MKTKIVKIKKTRKKNISKNQLELIFTAIKNKKNLHNTHKDKNFYYHNSLNSISKIFLSSCLILYYS